MTIRSHQPFPYTRVPADFDYTLVSYNDALEAMIYDLARDHLVDPLGYPAEIKQQEYDPSFAIRGLAVDTDKGLLLKLSYLHGIALRTVFRGRRRLTKEEVLAEYGGSGMRCGVLCRDGITRG